jgi:1-acyl-sn-glycerol-3-phosphate acyltransferase
METLRAIFVVCLALAITAVLLPVHLVGQWRRWPLRKTTAQTWHRWVARAMGLRIQMYGAPARTDGHGVLLVANHASWLDIVALGSVAPVSFIAKDDVRDWPVFGLLARLQDSVFVSREARSTTRTQAETIARRLADGDMIVLFPEGTTSCGNFVYPFKSSLFGALGIGTENGAEATVQPVAIAYTGVDGVPMGRQSRPLAAWPGDIGIGPHLVRILREGRIDIHVGFGDPMTVAPGTNRKRLASETESAVRRMMSALVRGQRPSSAGPQKPLRTAHEQR